MDWQDELRRLDKQLSEGDISAQEYRRMRDELLAEASAPAQGKNTLWSNARPDVKPPPEPAPKPAPAPESANGSAEDTQVVKVPSNGAPPQEKTPPAEDPDKTATVSAATVASSDATAAKMPTFPPRPPQQPVPPPPMTGLQPQAPWSGQVIGEEVFADAKPPRNGRKIALVALVLVVALAVAGGAVWYFGSTETSASDNPQPSEPAASEPAAGEPQSNAPEPTPNQPKSLPEEVAAALKAMPGTADPNSGTISAQQAGGLKLVHPDEVKLATSNGVSDVIFRGSTNGSVGHALLVLTTPDEKAADKLTTAEQTFLRDNDFTEGEQLATGQPVLERTDQTGTVYRVIYTSGRYTVRLGVAQRGADPADLRAQLEAAAKAVARVLPAT
ncbi:MAG TPA: SHOCT domain-containing protein [Actinophytocola sp.]|nr:SHOCT domain-containing protein [Actinophytocola sp.]